ncbi:MAG: hypothetical protein NZM29_01115, partial [Nitrospira sp.]|nr:hypothetical protein [Nitrospira sp.]
MSKAAEPVRHGSISQRIEIQIIAITVDRVFWNGSISLQLLKQADFCWSLIQDVRVRHRAGDIERFRHRPERQVVEDGLFRPFDQAIAVALD